jgi:hypothetical protein
MTKRRAAWAGVAVGLASLVACCSCCIFVPDQQKFLWYERVVVSLGGTITGTDLERSYRYRIKEGMTVEEVEAVLGPGTETGSPTSPGGRAVVTGDKIIKWNGENSTVLYIGFREGRVCDKHFWWPSL